jgi:cytochrome c biogenesis protein CcmG/thiol:disulfide interchange protein DsbE
MKTSLFWALALASLCACSGAHSSNAIARVGSVAPNWTEPTASGGTLSLSSLRGRPVYLNFFATWCPPCNAEAPSINALQKRYIAQGLEVVGVDELEDRAKAAAFEQKYGLVYPAVIDSGTLQAQYDVNGLPVHVFIDRQGVIKEIVTGEMTEREIARHLRAILTDGPS